jgi:DEAD/DEAH box helicase domain-containing protein
VFGGLDRPAGRISLRSSGPATVAVIDAASGTLIGSVDEPRAPATVHPGAVYLHQGEPQLVRELDLEARVAVVERFTGDYYTQPKTLSAVTILEAQRQTSVGGTPVELGAVEMREQVVGFQRRRISDHRPVDLVELDLPARSYTTQAVWFCPHVGDAHPLLGSLHAAEHAMISLLPLLAICDRGDLGGLSTSHDAHTQVPTVFVYDGHPGGVGFAARGYELFADWTARTAQLVRECPCRRGCPSCVQSPKCGDLNHPLDKAGAIHVLERITHGGRLRVRGQGSSGARRGGVDGPR